MARVFKRAIPMPMRFLAAALLAGSLLASLAAMSNFPAPAGQSTSAFASQSAKQEKPDDVLARAKQLYNEEGAKVALPVFDRAHFGPGRSLADRSVNGAPGGFALTAAPCAGALDHS